MGKVRIARPNKKAEPLAEFVVMTKESRVLIRFLWSVRFCCGGLSRPEWLLARRGLLLLTQRSTNRMIIW